jgi:hypothetical protein
VAITANAARNPAAPSVAAFLSRYFGAINARDYRSYASLLSPSLQQGLTEPQFSKGYGSTADSDETLVSISAATDGDLDAAVMFTSHQNPQDSPDHAESCTDWSISLFLARGGSGYLIDQPPSGYRASYRPCS